MEKINYMQIVIMPLVQISAPGGKKKKYWNSDLREGLRNTQTGANRVLAVRRVAAVISEWIDCEELKSAEARLLTADGCVCA